MKLLTNEQIWTTVLKWEPKYNDYNKHCGWYRGEENHIYIVPPFDSDIQACFDYIVPMLLSKDEVLTISMNIVFEGNDDPDSAIYMFYIECEERRIEGDNKKPALAFIEALSKWWEDQKD